MKYTTSIHSGSYDRPVGEFDENENIVYRNEHYDIDVLDVAMQSQIKNQDEVKQLAAQLYPQVIEILGENPYMGVRVLLDRTIKFIVSAGYTPNEFERAMLREFTAMRFDLDMFGLEKENG